MLVKLKKVDLRKGWQHEAQDFTTWLSQEENLSILSDEVGVGIRLLKTEAGVGTFFADILAEEENTGRKIIIENQLETTDHDHLGKLITYASGQKASIIIWIVREAREEHREAIDWLNDHTDDDTNFFLIKLELWQIGDSPYAPNFQIISKPNEWAKAVKMQSQGTLTDTKVLQLNFWTKFKDYAEKNKAKFRLRKPFPQHWYDLSFGSSDAHISLSTNTQIHQISCEVYISDNKDLFSLFEKNKEQIEKQLGEKLEWMPLEGKKASRIKLVREGDINSSEQWNEYFEWFKQKVEIFQKVFGKYAKMMKS